MRQHVGVHPFWGLPPAPFPRQSRRSGVLLLLLLLNIPVSDRLAGHRAEVCSGQVATVAICEPEGDTTRSDPEACHDEASQ